MTQYSVQQVVEFYQTNPAFVRYVNMFKPRRVGACAKSCPSLGSLTVLIATYFDNGEPAKKAAGRSRARHSMQFEGWTDSAALDFSAPDWKINVALQPRDKLLTLIEGQLANGSISEAYYETLSRIAEVSEPTLHFGQFFHNDGGQTYFDHQFCMVDLIDGRPAFVAVANGDPDRALALPDSWSAFYPDGETRLKGSAVCQLRWDITGDFAPQESAWPTARN